MGVIPTLIWTHDRLRSLLEIRTNHHRHETSQPSREAAFSLDSRGTSLRRLRVDETYAFHGGLPVASPQDVRLRSRGRTETSLTFRTLGNVFVELALIG